MSNEFDKEVAAKIADRAITEARKESEEKYGKSLTDGLVWYETFDSGNFTVKWTDEPQTNNLPKEEISKIDFYRQKVQQYEAVENLIQSIECELEDVIAAKLELNEYSDDVYSHKAHLSQTYKDMERIYKSNLNCLKDLLKRV